MTEKTTKHNLKFIKETYDDSRKALMIELSIVLYPEQFEGQDVEIAR
jgi:hypothetical protein